MRKYQKEMIKLTSKKILSTIFGMALPFFEASSVYRVSARKFRRELENENIDYAEWIKYLKRAGLIEVFIEGKEKYLEITPKGMDRLKMAGIDHLSIQRPAKWDGKWRVVIFDIPERHKVARDILRSKLVVLGFEKIQESVYAHPFECTEPVSQLASALNLSGNLLLMISEVIQGEDQIIERFLDKNILSVADLKKV